MNSSSEATNAGPSPIITGAWNDRTSKLEVKKDGHVYKVLTLGHLKAGDMSGDKDQVTETATQIAKLFIEYQDEAAKFEGVGEELADGDTLSARNLKRAGDSLINHAEADKCSRIMQNMLALIHGKPASSDQATQETGNQGGTTQSTSGSLGTQSQKRPGNTDPSSVEGRTHNAATNRLPTDLPSSQVKILGSTSPTSPTGLLSEVEVQESHDADSPEAIRKERDALAQRLRVSEAAQRTLQQQVTQQAKSHAQDLERLRAELSAATPPGLSSEERGELDTFAEGIGITGAAGLGLAELLGEIKKKSREADAKTHHQQALLVKAKAANAQNQENLAALETARSNISELRESLEEKEEALEIAQAEIVKLRSDLDRESETHGTGNQAHQLLQEQFGMLSQDLQGARRDLERLRAQPSENVATADELHDARGAVKRLEREMQSIGDRLGVEKTEDPAALQKAISAELRNNRKKIKSQERYISSLRTNISSLADRLSDALEGNASAEAQEKTIKNLQRDLERTKRELERARGQVSTGATNHEREIRELAALFTDPSSPTKFRKAFAKTLRENPTVRDLKSALMLMKNQLTEAKGKTSEQAELISKLGGLLEAKGTTARTATKETKAAKRRRLEAEQGRDKAIRGREMAERDLENATAELEELRKLSPQLDEALAEVERLKSSQASASEDSALDIKRLEGEIADLQASLKGTTAVNTKQCKELEKLILQRNYLVRNQKASHNRLKDVARDYGLDDGGTSDEIIQRIHVKLGSMQTDFDSNVKRLQASEERVVAQGASLEATNTVLESEKARTAQLSQDILELRSDVAELTGTLALSEALAVKLKGERDLAIEGQQSAEEALAVANKELQIIRPRLNEAMLEMGVLREIHTSSEVAKNQKIQLLESEIQTLQATVDSEGSANEGKIRALKRLRSKKEELEGERSQTLATLQDIAEEYNLEKTGTTSELLERVQDKLGSLKEALTAQTRLFTESEREVRQRDTSLEEAREDLLAERAKTAFLSEETLSLSKRVGTLVNDLENSEERVLELEGENKELRTEKAKLEAKLEVAETQLRGVTAEFEKAKRTMAIMARSSQKASGAHSSAIADLNEQIRDLRRVKDELEEANTGTLTPAIERLENQLVKLSSDKEKLKAQAGSELGELRRLALDCGLEGFEEAEGLAIRTAIQNQFGKLQEALEDGTSALRRSQGARLKSGIALRLESRKLEAQRLEMEKMAERIEELSVNLEASEESNLTLRNRLGAKDLEIEQLRREAASADALKSALAETISSIAGNFGIASGDRDTGEVLSDIADRVAELRGGHATIGDRLEASESRTSEAVALSEAQESVILDLRTHLKGVEELKLELEISYASLNEGKEKAEIALASTLQELEAVQSERDALNAERESDRPKIEEKDAQIRQLERTVRAESQKAELATISLATSQDELAGLKVTLNSIKDSLGLSPAANEEEINSEIDALQREAERVPGLIESLERAENAKSVALASAAEIEKESSKHRTALEGIANKYEVPHEGVESGQLSTDIQAKMQGLLDIESENLERVRITNELQISRKDRELLEAQAATGAVEDDLENVQALLEEQKRCFEETYDKLYSTTTLMDVAEFQEMRRGGIALLGQKAAIEACLENYHNSRNEGLEARTLALKNLINAIHELSTGIEDSGTVRAFLGVGTHSSTGSKIAAEVKREVELLINLGAEGDFDIDFGPLNLRDEAAATGKKPVRGNVALNLDEEALSTRGLDGAKFRSDPFQVAAGALQHISESEVGSELGDSDGVTTVRAPTVPREEQLADSFIGGSAFKSELQWLKTHGGGRRGFAVPAEKALIREHHKIIQPTYDRAVTLLNGLSRNRKNKVRKQKLNDFKNRFDQLYGSWKGFAASVAPATIPITPDTSVARRVVNTRDVQNAMKAGRLSSETRRKIERKVVDIGGSDPEKVKKYNKGAAHNR